MSFTKIEEHVAWAKLQLISSTGWVSRFMLVWKNRPLLVSFNHLSAKVFDIYYLELLDEDEINFIVSIIKEYLNYEED